MDDIEQLSKRVHCMKFGVINDASKVPLTESNVTEALALQNATNSRPESSKRRPSKTSGETKNALNNDEKENVDSAFVFNVNNRSNVNDKAKILIMVQKQPKLGAIAELEEDVSTPSSCIRDSSRIQLNRLGALYSHPENLSSPVHRIHESVFGIEQENETQQQRSSTKLKKSNKLAELANSFHEWEDESVSKNRSQKSNTNDQMVATPNKIIGSESDGGVKSPSKQNNNKWSSDANCNDSSKQKLISDKMIINDLESHGSKDSNLTNKCSKNYFNVKSNGKQLNTMILKDSKRPAGARVVDNDDSSLANHTRQKPTDEIEFTKGLVSGRAALFETSTPRAINTNTITLRKNVNKQKDPAEMSLKERMALFEKNKGEAILPKAPLSLGASVKQIMAHKDNSEKATQIKNGLVNSVKLSPSSGKINDSNKATRVENIEYDSGIPPTIDVPVPLTEYKIVDEKRNSGKQAESVVLNQYADGNLTPLKPSPNNLCKSNSSRHKDKFTRLGVSGAVRRSLESLKRIKVKSPKNGHVYPALSEIESSGTERNTPENYTPEPAYVEDVDNKLSNNDDFMSSSQDEGDGQDEEYSYIDSEDELGNVCDRRDGRPYANSYTTTNSDDSDFEKYLDEAIDNIDNDMNIYPSKIQKDTVPSNSFTYLRKPFNRYQETIFEDEDEDKDITMRHQSSSPIESRLSVKPSDDNNSIPMTVSSYRHQQKKNSPTVHKVVVHTQPVEQSTTDDNTDYCDEAMKGVRELKFIKSQENLVEQKIHSLLVNAKIQNLQIAQTSNALNICASTPEFIGSIESVVARWKLLVATHSHKAAIQEVQRLRIERCLRSLDAPKECGRIKIKDILLPLRDDYVKKVSEENVFGHYLVCLLKYNEHVLATKIASTFGSRAISAVHFPDELQLDGVYADFRITLEIYGIVGQRESLPHEDKYHIKNVKKSLIKTPKSKKTKSTLINSAAQSNAVQAPKFEYYGFIIFSLREVQQNEWIMNQVSPGVLPLDGTVKMKINYALSVTIEHKAFLTMFEEMSGFGAWHRRWCRLHGNILSYWKYPDDARFKPPMGSLDLSACEQHKVSVAPRDLCARLNTLMIELKRPRRNDDKATMLLRSEGEYSYVRHLLSADTKEERDEWCAYFNKTLALMRAWGQSERFQMISK